MVCPVFNHLKTQGQDVKHLAHGKSVCGLNELCRKDFVYPPPFPSLSTYSAVNSHIASRIYKLEPHLH
jgi:hypothetical protein